MSARQIARLRALIEEKKREAEEVNDDIDEEEYYEEPTKVSFSVSLEDLCDSRHLWTVIRKKRKKMIVLRLQ